MIRPYRTLHRGMFVVFGLLLGLLLVFSRGGPGEASMNNMLPPSPALPAGFSFGEAADFYLKALGPLRLREAGTPVAYVELTLTEDMAKPDVLVYQSGDGTLENARLLGALEGKTANVFRVMPKANTLVFYSLGHREILGSINYARGEAQ